MSGTLLLADDSITIQKVVELTFAETEHKVFAVGSGRDLLQRLPEIKPDVVLCDVVMPDMNGYEVCQILKSDPNTLHIPVVLLTGTFEPFDRDRAQAAGCDAIVTKPFEARELITIVEDLLGRAQMVAAAPAPTDYGALGEQGIPDGVPSLDFSTSGFDRMVPQVPAAPAIPEDGIDLTASSLGDSHPSQPIQAPPELAEPAVPTAVSPQSFAFGGEEPRVFDESPQPPRPSPPPFEPEPPVTPEPFLVEEARSEPAKDFFALGPSPAREAAPAFAPEPVIEPAPEVQSAPVFAPEVVAPPPTPAPPTAAELLTDEHVERIARRAAELVPPPPAPLSAAELLTDEHVERVAKRAVELMPPPPAPLSAAELLTDEHVERVAKRAVELMPPPPAPLSAAELLTDEHVERVAKRAVELMPPPPAPLSAAELLTDEHVERVAKRAVELMPPPPPPAATADFSDEQVEKIARRVVELAAPVLERIAWEVIPDMAEMLVRKRIADLERAAEEDS